MHLAADFGHARPAVEDVSGAVAAQAGEIFGREEFRIADFDGVAIIARKGGQEWIQFLEECANIWGALFGEAAKLKNQCGDARLIGRQQIQKRTLKEGGVQE